MIPFAASLLLKSTAVTMLALAAVRFAWRARASVRHLVLAAAFGVLLALPLVSIVAPAIAIPIPILIEAARPPMPAGPLAPAVEIDASAQVVGDRVSPAVHPNLPWPSWPLLVAGIWAIGAALFLLPIGAGLLQVRALRRSGSAWPRGQAIADRLARDAAVGRRVEVLIHDAVPGPVTCGVIHPVILLPADARTWIDDDLWRAVLHELEHVRRADWATHCAARLAAALYWCHPLVWTARRELSLEAERACDDAVVAHGRTDATLYADQLVSLAQRLSTAPNRPLLAMANRRDLSARVRAVLDGTQRRGRTDARWIALVCAVSALAVLAMSPIRLVASVRVTSGTGQPAAAPRFSAVTIKPCAAADVPPPSGPRGRGAGAGNVSASPGSLHIDCMTVQNMIARAYIFFGEPLLNEYGPPRDDSPRVKGGPSWIRSEKYTLEATADEAADRKTLMGPMLRAFLEERLQLKTHRDVEEMPAYALTVAKGGLKISPIASDAECKPECGMMARRRTDTGRLIDLGGMEREILITVLNLDRHVIDRTGLPESARYNIHLELPDDPQAQPGDPTNPEVFRAIEQQLGLKLEAVRAPHGVIVIDQVVRP